MTHAYYFKQNKQLKKNIMGYLLYIVAIIMLIAWAVGYFAFSMGSLIHILLVIAFIAILLRIIRGNKPL